MRLLLPDPCLVVLIGASGSGKSTFARRHFRPTEVLSSDACRALVRDDESDQQASRDAFEVLHFIAARRLAAGRLTVVDATNVRPLWRRPLLLLARQNDCPAAAIVFDLPEDDCLWHNQTRPRRTIPLAAVQAQIQHLRASLPQLEEEGFQAVYLLRSAREADQAVVERRRATRQQP